MLFDFSNTKWGSYASSLNFGDKHPVFLAEGTYTGAPPSIDLANSSATVYTNAALTSTTLITQFITTPINGPTCPICGIEIYNDGAFLNVIATTPGSVSHTFNVTADLPQPGQATWGNPVFVAYNGSGPLPAGVDLPTFNVNTFNAGTITWNTTHAPIGTYRWSVTASAQGYSDTGYLFVNIVAIPEPSTLGLLAMATIGGLVRRRRA